MTVPRTDAPPLRVTANASGPSLSRARAPATASTASSSRMVPVALSAAMNNCTGLDSVTANVSSSSGSVSVSTGTRTVFDVSPAAKVNMPFAAV